MRQEGRNSLSDVAHNAQIETTAATQVVASDVHLNDGLPAGIPVGIREVRSEHQEHVASTHRVVAGSETDQARHADVVGVVVLDKLLASQGVNDRRLDGLGEFHQLVVGARASGPSQDGHPLVAVQQIREASEVAVARSYQRTRRLDGVGEMNIVHLLLSDVPGEDDHGNASLRNRVLHRNL